MRVRIGVAGQNLFDIAYAWLLAGDRGVRDAVEFEMLLGMDTGPTDAVRDDIEQLLLYTPVVKPAGVRRRDLLSRASARGERQQRQLHVGGVRDRRQPRAARP